MPSALSAWQLSSYDIDKLKGGSNFVPGLTSSLSTSSILVDGNGSDDDCASHHQLPERDDPLQPLSQHRPRLRARAGNPGGRGPAGRFVMDVMPEGHVFMGTDYPYDMADTDPVGSVKAAVKDEAQRTRICGEYIAAVLGLS